MVSNKLLKYLSLHCDCDCAVSSSKLGNLVLFPISSSLAIKFTIIWLICLGAISAVLTLMASIQTCGQRKTFRRLWSVFVILSAA